MPHLHRFHIDPATQTAPEMALSPEEAHHALRVVRVQRGDRVVLFDGRGRELTATVAEATRRDVVVHVEEERRHPLPAHRLNIAQAWLHREKAIEFLVRHGTELGVHRFIFYAAARSEKKPKPSDKWERWAIEACKQTGRLWVPEFVVVEDLVTVLRRATGSIAVAAIAAEHQPMTGFAAEQEVTLLLGPEGDFTDGELGAAVAAGAVPVSLGQYVYRSEVAAVVGATLLQYAWGELGGH
jgi:16S rRNA (uracil1498-N3)-methyltransferase